MAFILFRLLVLGVIAAAADDVQITWLTPPRGVVPCVVAEQGRAQRRPPPPLNPDGRPRQRQYRRRGDDDVFKRLAAENSAEVVISRNGTTGVHQCAVTHRGQLVLGYPVRWQFASMDKRFSKHPANATARAGQPFALDCQITSAPSASISWLRDGQALPRNDRFIILETQLLFTEVRKEDAGIYRCTATNPYLNRTSTSQSGQLKVLDPVDAEPGMLELRDRVNVTAPKHSRVRLLCPVVGWPKPVITWEITPPGSRTAILEVTDEILELTSLEQDQEGVYKCSIDGYSHLYKMFNVSVSEPVVITLQPVSKEVIRASTVRFNCTATGRPAPNISWFKDGRPLQLGGRFNLRSSTFGNRYELVVGGVTSADAGVYQCFANNGASPPASSWASLGVTGASAAAPAAVRCWPLEARAVTLRWARPHADVMAYTVLASLPGWPGLPHTNTEEIIPLPEPFTTYSFQVRAYIRGAAGKNVASDMSDTVTCQGQGVPVRIFKQSEDTVIVSWKHFAESTSNVVQWMLQYRPENTTYEKNITLPGETLNYTLKVSPNEPLEVRVLGSKEMEWLPQNLTSLAWTSTTNYDEIGEVTVIPEDLRVSDVRAREMTVRWRCECPDTYAFLVCAKRQDGTGKCLDSYNSSATIPGLSPGAPYAVRVSARAPGRAPGPPSAPLLVTTLADGPERFKELTYKFINSSTLRVSWNAPPSKYTVSYSTKLDMPMDLWDSMETLGNTALIPGVDPNKDTYVMVTGYDPLVYSQIKTIPAQLPEVQWWWTANGVGVRWRGSGRVLRYSQNLTRSLDDWPALAVRGDRAELTNLDPALPTYLVVAGPVLSHRNQVFNIPVRPAESSPLYLGLGVGLGVCIVCLLALGAVCVWRRRKAAGSPLRPRRRNLSSNGDEDEEGSEMKGLGRLANGGGAKDAGEPLLNGHVRITENPQSKTPNGKMKIGLVPFDLARYEDANATQETVLDDSAAYELLDDSRAAEEPTQSPVQNPTTTENTTPQPTIHPHPLPAESFPKLPDDNMNSELTRSDRLDDSKLQPTLQPNG